jgi:nicotinate phosphoribosyltransferase
MSTYPGKWVSGLLTDLYELTMAAGYVEKGIDARATFELFIRYLPTRRNYFVAAGLEQALDFLENVRFSADDISYLRTLPLFRSVDSSFFDFLAQFRFSGDVWAVPEGTIFFPGEPLLRLTAPIAVAQLVETSLLSVLHLQTLIASKAARVSTAAQGRPVIEFGSRRAHGIEAGVFAARAAFIGGCQGTSNTYAGRVFGIPVYGTQAHSWIMAHDDEVSAFNNFLDIFPDQSTLVVDTYNVRAAVEKIIALGRKPHAIRLDSGDVCTDSQWARRQLDRIGWKDVKIFVSGDLDENRIAAMIEGCAQIDAFGVGTAVSTSADVPFLGVIYKLVEVETGGRVQSTAKFSEEKNTYPGRKQVFRFTDKEGMLANDVIGLEEESMPGAETLLRPVMRAGRRLAELERDPSAAVKAARDRFLGLRQALPSSVQSLKETGQPFPVRHSARLEQLSEQVRQRLVKATSTGSRRQSAVRPGIIFWEVDVQNDFMLPDGKLYVPQAEQIIPNVNRLVEACRQDLVFLVSSADAHNSDDPEFSDWPRHCLKGTPGAELIAEAGTAHRLVIPNRKGFAMPEDILTYQQVVLEKNTLDVFDNPNTDVLLTQLETDSTTQGVEVEFIVFGVVTEYCVRLTVEGLLRRHRRVSLVRDAIQSLDGGKGSQVLEDLQPRGCRLLTTGETLALLPSRTNLRELSDVEGKFA